MGKYKIGVLTEDLASIGGETLRKGQTVRYAKRKAYPDADGYTYAKYEYHYSNENGGNLIRTTKFLIQQS